MCIILHLPVGSPCSFTDYIWIHYIYIYIEIYHLNIHIYIYIYMICIHIYICVCVCVYVSEFCRNSHLYIKGMSKGYPRRLPTPRLSLPRLVRWGVHRVRLLQVEEVRHRDPQMLPHEQWLRSSPAGWWCGQDFLGDILGLLYTKMNQMGESLWLFNIAIAAMEAMVHLQRLGPARNLHFCVFFSIAMLKYVK